jgi:hypothetical protein
VIGVKNAIAVLLIVDCGIVGAEDAEGGEAGIGRMGRIIEDNRGQKQEAHR